MEEKCSNCGARFPEYETHECERCGTGRSAYEDEFFNEWASEYDSDGF